LTKGVSTARRATEDMLVQGALALQPFFTA